MATFSFATLSEWVFWSHDMSQFDENKWQQAGHNNLI